MPPFLLMVQKSGCYPVEVGASWCVYPIIHRGFIHFRWWSPDFFHQVSSMFGIFIYLLNIHGSAWVIRNFKSQVSVFLVRSSLDSWAGPPNPRGIWSGIKDIKALWSGLLNRWCSLIRPYFWGEGYVCGEGGLVDSPRLDGFQVNGYWTWVAAHGSGAPVKLPYDPWQTRKNTNTSNVTGEEANRAMTWDGNEHAMIYDLMNLMISCHVW